MQWDQVNNTFCLLETVQRIAVNVLIDILVFEFYAYRINETHNPWHVIVRGSYMYTFMQ